MGERIIRPGIRTSEAVAENIRKGGWMSGVMYVWLLTIVDDYGRYDARPAILKSELFPFLQDLVREADVQRSLENMSRSGLVRLYSHDGKPYLEIQKFRQRLRAKRSKWPAPQDACQSHANAGQCHDNVVTMPSDTDTETDTEKERKPPEKPPADHPPEVPNPKVNGTESPKKPYGPPKTDVQKVVAGFKAVMNVPDDDREWDAVYFRRYSRPAADLLRLCGGDVLVVADCIDQVSAAMEKKGLSWTPETIVKHAGDWKNGRLFK